MKLISKKSTFFPELLGKGLTFLDVSRIVYLSDVNGIIMFESVSIICIIHDGERGSDFVSISWVIFVVKHEVFGFLNKVENIYRTQLIR